MRRLPHIAVALLLATIFVGCSSDSSAVKVRFVVTVPQKLDSAETLYISGNMPEVGNWSGRGLPLELQPGGEYQGTAQLPRGGKLEFKVTRGSWETVEKGPNGEEVANRVVQLDRDRTEAITVESWRSPDEDVLPTATGDIRYHRKFHSKILKNDRSLIVWLPPGYEDDPTKRYPVFYMHDGQNLFDDATSFAGEWRADETARYLIAQNLIEPIIIVGIEAMGVARVDEYTPTQESVDSRSSSTAPTKPSTKPSRMEGGKGEPYAQFLITEVKPFIDSTYRTLPDREHTAVGGASLGGLISLYLGYQHGDVFSKVAVVSPSLWWDHRKMLIALETDNAWMRRSKLWVDMGTEEGSGVNPLQNIANTRELYAIMSRAGLKPNRDFIYREFEGAGHNEQAWADRFDQILLFLFGK